VTKDTLEESGIKAERPATLSPLIRLLAKTEPTSRMMESRFGNIPTLSARRWISRLGLSLG